MPGDTKRRKWIFDVSAWTTLDDNDSGLDWTVGGPDTLEPGSSRQVAAHAISACGVLAGD